MTLAKRIFDIAGAALALSALALPLMVLAVVIKLDSPGPALYRQERVGRHGRIFRIHKLRTMRHAAGGPLLTVGSDARITRVGAWLRRTRLDELPQFIDVLRGDMSLVGPRPEVPRYVALYPAGLRERALAVRPGMTDPASLALLDEGERLARAADPEAEYTAVILPRKLQAAIDYAEHATLWSDVQVLARTLIALVRSA